MVLWSVCDDKFFSKRIGTPIESMPDRNRRDESPPGLLRRVILEFRLALSDLSYGYRRMRQSPLFSLTIILTVALAIGANATIFSSVNAVMIRPMPFKAPDRLVQVAEKNDKLNLPNFGVSVLNYLSWRELAHSFEDFGAAQGANYTVSGTAVSGTAEPELYAGGKITASLLPVLGLHPIAGRGFSDQEERPGAAPVVMIGQRFWKKRFGADPTLLGRSIVLDRQATTVVGIAPDELALVTGTQSELYTPLTIDPPNEIRLSHVLVAFARLRPGVSLKQAQLEMNSVSLQMGRQYPEIRDWSIRVLGMFESFVTPELRDGLLMLWCAVVFVILIACANIANLLLATGTARQGEMAVRAAMGASRGRLLRQLLTECVLLSMAGGIPGVLGAIAAVEVMNRVMPANLLPIPEVTLDFRLLWFDLGLTIATGVLFGIVPAWRSAHPDLSTVLRAGRARVGRFPRRLRSGFAAFQVALAAFLLIGAGLFIRNLINLRQVNLGFDPARMITFQLALPEEQYPPTTKGPQFFRSLVERLRSIPGVRGAAVSSAIPFGNGLYSRHPMITTDPSVLPHGSVVPIDWRMVSPGYFHAMQIPLLKGRNFTDADGPLPAPPVIIVSETTGKLFWGNGDPIGHTLRQSGDQRQVYTIVGVVGDIRSTVLTTESPTLYYPTGRRVWQTMDIVVRAEGAPEALLPAIRKNVHELDPNVALADVRTMDERLSDTAALPRLNALLLTALAVVALLIGSIGIYGVLAYSVGQRRSEIGVRMAMGATQGGVWRLILFDGMRVVLVGLSVGLLGGMVLSEAVSSMVFRVNVQDPLIFSAVGIALAAAAFLASSIPALRAARVDPAVALRQE